jgi:hypothetical protein
LNLKRNYKKKRKNKENGNSYGPNVLSAVHLSPLLVRAAHQPFAAPGSEARAPLIGRRSSLCARADHGSVAHLADALSAWDASTWDRFVGPIASGVKLGEREKRSPPHRFLGPPSSGLLERCDWLARWCIDCL